MTDRPSPAALAEELAAIARIGLAWQPSPFDQARYRRILEIATRLGGYPDGQLGRWQALDAADPSRYVTPKAAVLAWVFNRAGELLLVERAYADSAARRGWCPPVGWADVGHTPAENTVREVLEEAGLQAEVERFAGVWDNRVADPGSRHHIYRLVFACRLLSGQPRADGYETLDAGFFPEDALPPIAPAFHRETADAFRHQRGELEVPHFD